MEHYHNPEISVSNDLAKWNLLYSTKTFRTLFCYRIKLSCTDLYTRVTLQNWDKLDCEVLSTENGIHQL